MQRLIPPAPHRDIEPWDACVQVIQLRCLLLQRETANEIRDPLLRRLSRIEVLGLGCVLRYAKCKVSEGGQDNQGLLH